MSADSPDLVGVALGSIGAGAGAGAGIVAIALLLWRHQAPAILPVLPFMAIAAAAAVAWVLARPIADWWRRGVTAALAVFAGLLLAALTAPVDMVAGRAGLGTFGAVSLAAGMLAARSVRRRYHGG